MCGIVGQWNLDGQPVERATIKAMCDLLTHRGPDESGIYMDEDSAIGLGHRRLNIIDLKTGQQPMSYQSESLWITFNGEIYNFQEIRSQLISKKYQFKTNSDTEVILAAYEAYGEECVQYFEGMFAFAIWDANKKKLFLATDRLGKKPLYYYQDDKVFIFASEPKSILLHSFVNQAIDYRALIDYFHLGYILSPKTIYRKIRKLEPAEHLVIGPKETKKRIYWDIKFSPDFGVPFKKACEEFENLLFEAVKKRMISDVPLGAFLSGGMDSSVVVAIMSQNSSKPVKTVSIGFEEEEYNELSYAHEIVKRYKTDHYEKIVKSNDLNLLPNLIRYFDEPFSDDSLLPTYALAKTTREKVTVALSGDGGDENLIGYNRYQMAASHLARYSNLPKSARVFFKYFSHLYPRSNLLPWLFRGKQTVQSLSMKPIDAYINNISILNNRLSEVIFSPELSKQMHTYDPFDRFRKLYHSQPKEAEVLSKLQYVDIKTYLTDDILVKVDRMSMANSLEVRSPFLDHKLMEFLARLPVKHKYENGMTKRILRTVAERLLPEKILKSRKKGFTLPQRVWFRGSLGRNFAAQFQKDKLPILNTKIAKQLLCNHRKGYCDNSGFLWSYLIWRTWQNEYLAK